MANKKKQTESIDFELNYAQLIEQKTEKAVVGEILIDCVSPDVEKVLRELPEEAFTNSHYRTLFSLMKSMQKSGTPIDMLTLTSEASKEAKGEYLASLTAEIVACTEEVASSTHILKHANILSEDYTRRRLIANRQRAIERYADKGTSLDDIYKEEEDDRKLLLDDNGKKYSHLLEPFSEADLIERLRSKQADLNTEYEFNLPTGEKEVLTLPSGAITIICAPSSHGKSTLLQNLALQVAQGEDKGDTLYFTYEEDGDSVFMQMLNKYADTQLAREVSYVKNNNLRTIANYYKGKNYISREAFPTFEQKRKEFIALLESGKLRLYNEDYEAFELVEAIKEISRQLQNKGGKVKAVFIDYIQLLNIRDTKLQKREELRVITQALRKLAISLQIPIVVAGQLNRETTSPLELRSENLAEASDLEREANKIICLWNTSFKAKITKKTREEDLTEWEKDNNVKLGEEGQIFAIITKNRSSVRGITAVLEYNGITGKIAPNLSPETKEALKRQAEDEAIAEELKNIKESGKENVPF